MSTTTSNTGMKNIKQVPRKSIFVEHMNDEVPGYGKSAKIMNSLLTHRDHVQTGSNGKIQDCTHLFEDALSRDGPVPAATIVKSKTASRAVSSPFPVMDKSSPMRETFSKLKSSFEPAGSEAKEEIPLASTTKVTPPVPTRTAGRKFSVASLSSLRGSIRRR